MRRVLLASLGLSVVVLGCPVEEPPPIRGVQVGTVVGEVFVVDDGGEPVSLAGAEVAVYGTPASATSESGKQFVLGAVPVGKHTVVIDHAALGRAARFEIEVSQPFQTVILSPDDTTLGAPSVLRGVVNVAGESAAGTLVYLVGGNGRQQTAAGDDGSYELPNLPRGAAQIAYSKAGFETKLIDVELGEGDNVADAVSLAASSAGDLCFGSTVQLVGDTQHQGVAVLLNGGEQVTSTTVGGNYRFCDLGPGLYSVKAQAPGYKSMELAQVALDTDGDAHGLVPAYLSAGNDAEGVDVPDFEDRDFTVEIVSPAPGAQVEIGTEVTLSALAQDDGTVLPPSSITWTRQAIADPLPAPVTIGVGDVLVTSDLTVGQHRLRATAVASDGRSKVAERVVTITPFDYGLSAEILPVNAGAIVYADAPFTLGGDATVRQGITLDDDDFVWTARPEGDAAATPITLGAQQQLTTATLAAGQWRVTLTVTIEGGLAVATDDTSITVHPVDVAFVPNLSFGAQDVAYTDLIDGNGDPYGIRFEMFEGQAVAVGLVVDHPLYEEDLASTAIWESDTAYAFNGPNPELQELPAATHTFVVTVTDAEDRTAEWSVVVVVKPFAFSVGVIAPRLEGEQLGAQDPPPYFTDFGLPLRATASHPYQSAFHSSQARWYRIYDDDNNAGTPDVRVHVASGLVTRTFTLPSGAGVLQLELTDDAGNVATATAQYVLQEVSFSASLVSPQEGIDILEGESIQGAVSYTHNLVGNGIDESELVVRYLSSINGLLTSTTGLSSFGVNEQPSFQGLSFGTHTITATINDGHGRIAQSRRKVIVRTPGVQATLVTPFDGLVLFPNVTTLDLNVNTSHDGAVSPLYSWKLDDVEFPASYDDYGTTATSSARATINLGAFTPGSGAFTDTTAWSEGNHRLEFFMRLPEIDTQYGGACVNVPQKAVCIRFNLVVSGPNPDVCTSVTTRDVVGPVEVWSGVKRLNCEVEVEAGTKLQIQPGTRVIVEPNISHRVEVRGGELVVGDPSGANTDAVTFEVQGAAAGPGKWGGIFLIPAAETTPSLVELHNVTLKHASNAVEGYVYKYGGSENVTRLKGVTIEASGYGVRGFCPDVFEDVTFRDIVSTAIYESSAKNCLPSRTWSDFVVEGARDGIELNAGGDVLIENATLLDVAEEGIYAENNTVGSLTVRASRFERIGSDANQHGAVEVRGCQPLTVLDSTFANNVTGINLGALCNDTTLDDTPRLLVARSLFNGHTRAIYDQSETNRASEVHVSSFEQNATDIYTLGLSEDVQAQGNYMGALGDLSSPTGALLANPVGRMPNLPRIHDYRDAPSSVGVVVRADNPLQARASTVADLPLAYVREPERSGRYNVAVDGGCVPLVAAAPDADLEVLQVGQAPTDPLDPSAPDVSCEWYLLDDAAAPNGSRTQVGADGDGCLASDLAEGEHALLLECTVNASGRIDQQVVELVVDNSTFQGRLRRSAVSWDGALTLSGDVMVPAGTELTIAPGAVITAKTSDAVRYGRYPNVPGSGDDAANVGFGKRGLVEIHVNGSVVVGSAAGAVTTLRGDALVQAKGIWGGFRVWRSGALSITNAEVTGATTVAHGYMDHDPNAAPDLHFNDVVVRDAEILVQGVCPRTMTGLTVERVTQPMKAAFCTESFTLTDSTFTNVGNTAVNHRLFEVDSYPSVGTSLQLLVDNVVLDRSVGTRANILFRIEFSDFTSLIVQNSQLYDFRTLYEFDVANTAPAYTVTLQGIVADNFEYIHGLQYNHLDSISVDGSLFLNGHTIFGYERQGRQISFTNNRTVDVRYPFRDMRFSTNFALLTATGNHFENATRVFWFRPEGTSGTDYQPTLSGNNFVGATEAVMWIDLYTGRSVTADMTGSYWGTSDVTAIRDLINDPQTSTGVPTYEEGRTNFTGYTTGALALTTP